VRSIANNRDSTRNQTFTYDSLNRIATGYTAATSGAMCWGKQFNIDQWSNLYSTTALSGYSNCSQTQISLSINGNNQASGYGYDLAGGMTYDGFYHYAYDAESRTCATGSTVCGSGTAYNYDGDGQRVEKSTGTLYWHGLGEVLSETALNGNNPVDYIYFNGSRLARVASSGTLYYFEDNLSSTRVNVQAGQSSACFDADFEPYGMEHDAITPTCTQNYKFTGKERDTESGNDYFGARYNSSSLGRFMSPDAFYKDSHVGDPQSWNEYSYARNNPLRYVDPNGENATVSTSCSTNENDQTTCNVTISASIAIYAAAGSGLTQDQLNQAAATIQNSIQDAWTGSFTQDGVTYNVTTQVTVSVGASQEAAMSSGAQNVIGMTNGPIRLPDGTLAGAYVNPKTLMGMLTGAPDTGMMDINGADDYAKHEFTHLLGTNNKPGPVLSNTNPATRPFSATSQDYGWGIREATSGVNNWVNGPQYRSVRYGELVEKPSVYYDRTTVGAPWLWWK
jgi:RHS repeat-associated protein